ncbi:MAG TPA: hypothetical protein VNX61_07990, partial [Rhizomicrobium sp.]|nr:hypothetical protein [Rhizomicrobium sp.]
MIKPIVAALLILVAAPAFPALQSQAWAQQAPPIAAPVGPQAESQSLAAPAGTINATGAGDSLTG